MLGFFFFFLSFSILGFLPLLSLIGTVFCSPREECSICGLRPLKIDLGISGNFSVVDIEAAGNRGGRHLRKRFTALPSGLVI